MTAPVAAEDRHIVLVGMMGAGKTTVGRDVAARLGRRMVDSDELIEARTGRTVREIFEQDGEPAFRVLETVDTATKESAVSFKERTDVTAVPAMGVVAETMVALVLAGEAQRKFGGDSVGEFVRNAEAYEATLPDPSW